MDNKILFGIYILLGFYLLYKIFELFNKPASKYKGYKEEINEILSSDKYKVKGRYD